MSYERLIYRQLPEFSSVIKLEDQPKYAIATLMIAFVSLIAGLALTSNKKSSFVLRFVTFAAFSAIASVFFGLGTVFLTDSFGVYV
ncbi:LAMI_0D02300g1_1 [Lachancea mirantina]|uniref:Dolichyl-diphosphooligosaccharide-protein glycosyltransferase subunit OST5 n=1 Tax=Lachancea mirantina TaxID=1230905 RepID=A0A1G4J937_9SACH|nr:LAMI_0D02300g1_1 [Lachancea mirantina]